eukprot:2374266-Rhodomonas_salina.1
MLDSSIGSRFVSQVSFHRALFAAQETRRAASELELLGLGGGVEALAELEEGSLCLRLDRRQLLHDLHRHGRQADRQTARQKRQTEETDRRERETEENERDRRERERQKRERETEEREREREREGHAMQRCHQQSCGRAPVIPVCTPNRPRRAINYEHQDDVMAACVWFRSVPAGACRCAWPWSPTRLLSPRRT